jgi:hypothetical protein
MTVRPRILASLMALVATALIAGCGGDDSDDSGGGEDPQAVLDAAFSSDTQVDSGVIELSLDLSSEGSQAGTVSASLNGPFQAGEEGQLPELDLTADASVDAAGQTLDFTGGVTLTGDGAFVNYNDTDYEVDAATFDLLQSSYEQSVQLQEEQGGEDGSLSQFGIDPSTWVPEPTDEGTEDLDGTEVQHVSGEVDIATMLSDLQSLAEQTGQSGQLDQAGIDQVEEAVEAATIDVYVSTEDDTLRKLDLNLDLTDPASGDSAAVTFSLGIADPNEPQDITAPTDAQPLEDLLNQIPGGAEALGGLGATGLGGTGSTGSTGTGSSGGAGSGGTPSPQDTQAYLDCLGTASTSQEISACQDLLP